MIDFLIFLCGAVVGMLTAVTIASTGKGNEVQEAYEEGKRDGFREGFYAASFERRKENESKH